MLDPELLFHLVPGWSVDRASGELVLRDAAGWTSGAFGVPDAFPSPCDCEIEDWAVELFTALTQPQPYLAVLERFVARVDVEELAVTLAQAELSDVLAPVGLLAWASTGRRTLGDWLRELR